MDGLFKKEGAKITRSHPLEKSIKDLEKKVESTKSDQIEVTNIDYVKKYLREELSILSKQLIQTIASIKTPESIKVSNQLKSLEISNFPKQLDEIKVPEIQNMVEAINDLRSIMAQIDFNPTVKVDAPKIPDIKIPEIKVPKQDAPIVNVNPEVEIDVRKIIDALKPLKLISNRPSKPISVRMTDGEKWVEAIKEAEGKVVRAFAAGGMTADEWKASYKSTRVQTEFRNGAKSAVGAVAVQMTDNSTGTENGVLIKAASTNDGLVYVGDNNGVTAGDTDATDGFELTARESIVVPIDKPSKIWLIASAAGQKVYWVAI